VSTFRHYITLIIFAVGLLAGVQLPNFVDQYEKRVDAHYAEAYQDLSGFQKIADLFHHGDIRDLIKKHESSPDPTYRAEAGPIQAIYQRKLRFEKEITALHTSFVGKVAHILIAGDVSIINETYENYSANLPLNTSAVACALIVAVTACLVLEFGIVVCRAVARAARRRRSTASDLPLRFR
jgi:hypothetical protein